MALVPVDLTDLMGRLRRYEAAMAPRSYALLRTEASSRQLEHTLANHWEPHVLLLRDMPPERQRFVMLGRVAIEAGPAYLHACAF